MPWQRGHDVLVIGFRLTSVRVFVGLGEDDGSLTE